MPIREEARMVSSKGWERGMSVGMWLVETSIGSLDLVKEGEKDL